MEEIIKEVHWLCQVKGFSPEHAAELVKIEALRQIGNKLDLIESDLSELLNVSGSDPADPDAVTKLMDKLGI